VRTSVTVSDAEHAALTAMAEKNRVSISWLIREAVREFLTKYDGQEKLPLTLPPTPGTRRSHEG
jgi:predicted transcriptional regulator